MESSAESSPVNQFAAHPRHWRDNRYVYPVCSRRAGGISIGINLNLDLRCTFNCVYCQVDRTGTVPLVGGPERGGQSPFPPTAAEMGTVPGRDAIWPVDLETVRAELAAMLSAAASGELLAEPEFASLPAPLRRINDVAFSGDGEPTGCPQFAEAAELVEQAVAAAGLDICRVLITNGSLLHLDFVRRGLESLHRSRGEIWVKLDAGSDDHFRRIARTGVPFSRIMENLTWSAQHWPIVIQSCFMQLDGQGLEPAEIGAYCDRLAEIRAAGGKISRVQIYTVARPPAEDFVTPLPATEVDAIVSAVKTRLPEILVQPFYGPG